MLQFDWDESKNESNRRKHGIWFEEALNVFNDPMSRVFHDSEHSSAEDRFIILGRGAGVQVLVVVHGYRDSDSIIRIISARKATKREVRFYEEGI